MFDFDSPGRIGSVIDSDIDTAHVLAAGQLLEVEYHTLQRTICRVHTYIHIVRIHI